MVNGKSDSTLRIFKPRNEVDKVCLMDGEMPQQEDEIAIDRMYADNNSLKVGDTIKVGGREKDHQWSGGIIGLQCAVFR